MAEFDPRRHLRIWRGIAVAALTTFLALWACVVAEVIHQLGRPKQKTNATTTRCYKTLFLLTVDSCSSHPPIRHTCLQALVDG